jgi:hypothetical protein
MPFNNIAHRIETKLRVQVTREAMTMIEKTETSEEKAGGTEGVQRCVIKPCPFCGGEGVESGDGTNAYILCVKCYSRGPICPPSEYLEGTDLDSIKLWNREAL